MPRMPLPKRLPALGIAILLHLLLAGVLMLRMPLSSPATPVVTMVLVPAAPVSPPNSAKPAPAIMPPPQKAMPIVAPQVPPITLPVAAQRRAIRQTAPTPPAVVEPSQPTAAPASETTSSPASTENIQSTALADPAPLLGNSAPEYPETARKKGIEGTVILKVSVDADGQPISVTVATSSGHDLLDAEALRTVRSWRFQPALAHGQAVAGLVMVPIVFRLHS